jgi:hypothetical protein
MAGAGVVVCDCGRSMPVESYAKCECGSITKPMSWFTYHFPVNAKGWTPLADGSVLYSVESPELPLWRVMGQKPVVGLDDVEPQPIHERYADKLYALLSFDLKGKNKAVVELLREMVEEVRRQESGGDPDSIFSETPGERARKIAEYERGTSWLGLPITGPSLGQQLAAMEGGSPTYTQGPVAKQPMSWPHCNACPVGTMKQAPSMYAWACDNCGHQVAFGTNAGVIGTGIRGLVDDGSLIYGQSPGECALIPAGFVPIAVAYRCPRHGTAPAFSKTPFTEADVPYGCPSCGSKLEKV